MCTGEGDNYRLSIPRVVVQTQPQYASGRAPGIHISTPSSEYPHSFMRAERLRNSRAKIRNESLRQRILHPPSCRHLRSTPMPTLIRPTSAKQCSMPATASTVLEYSTFPRHEANDAVSNIRSKQGCRLPWPSAAAGRETQNIMPAGR